MVAMWVANAVNLALNIVLVPDMLGLGVHGAMASAWATFGARTALAVFLVIFILRLPEAKDGVCSPSQNATARSRSNRSASASGPDRRTSSRSAPLRP